MAVKEEKQENLLKSLPHGLRAAGSARREGFEPSILRQEKILPTGVSRILVDWDSFQGRVLRDMRPSTWAVS